MPVFRCHPLPALLAQLFVSGVAAALTHPIGVGCLLAVRLLEGPITSLHSRFLLYKDNNK